MRYEVLEKRDSEVKVKITVPTEEFEQALQDVFRKDAKKYKIPGFRKGKATKGIIEKYYGESVFYEGAVNLLIPREYEAAVSELQLEPVARPDIDIEQVGKQKDFVFVAEITVEPEYRLEGYKGIEVSKVDTSVSEEMIDAEIQRNAKAYARLVSVERPVENGDVLTIDYAGSVDGEAFEGGTAENQSLTVGSGRFIPGFEEQLIGVNVGDEVLVKVTFPQEYHAESLAGKDAEFKVKVKEIKFTEMPELDDEFAKDVSEFDTFAEYRASVAEEMRKTSESNAKNEQTDRVVKAVIEKLEVELPEKMVEAEVDEMLHDLGHQLGHQGLSLDLYAQYMGGMDSLREQAKKDAVEKIKTTLVVKRVKMNENIVATDEDVEEELQRVAESQNRSVEEMRKVFSKDNFEYMKENIARRKAITFLVDHANFV